VLSFCSVSALILLFFICHFSMLFAHLWLSFGALLRICALPMQHTFNLKDHHFDFWRIISVLIFLPPLVFFLQIFANCHDNHAQINDHSRPSTSAIIYSNCLCTENGVRVVLVNKKVLLINCKIYSTFFSHFFLIPTILLPSIYFGRLFLYPYRRLPAFLIYATTIAIL
jgi:hypothetical protein